MRVAIVHDFLNQKGGAERVVAALARLFPGAPIYTSLFEPSHTHPEFAEMDVRTSFLQKVPAKQKLFRLLLPLYPLAFRRFDLSGFDFVVSSSTHWGHHVRVPDGLHVVYCHNPPRWLYQTEEYLDGQQVVPRFLQAPLKPLLWVLGRLDIKAASRPHLYLSNSKVTAERIRRLYGRDSIVVNPPVGLDQLLSRSDIRGPGQLPPNGGDHYLVVSRLLPYKRVDLAVSVCTERGDPLVVVGDGPMRGELEKMAGPNVRFAGKVGDEELADLYLRAKALIQCGVEDFGIGPLEANAAGIPTVAMRNGGALETVIEDVTGILFPEQGGKELNEALDKVASTSWDRDVLRGHASRFGEKGFHSRFLEAVESYVDSRLSGGAR